jgi:hypothetical protein
MAAVRTLEKYGLHLQVNREGHNDKRELRIEVDNDSGNPAAAKTR